MSKEQFETIHDQLLSIKKDDVKDPNMPVAIFVQEAEDLEAWATTDRIRLQKRGLDPALLDSLGIRAGALRYQQGIWQADTDTRNNALEAWKNESPAGYDLRTVLFHDLRFAFRENPKLLRRVDEIEEGSGHADMIQDLASLAQLAGKNPALLTAINFETEKLDTAKSLAKTLGDLLALNNKDKKEDSKVKDMRDRCFVYLKAAVDTIREYGKYEFWREPERLKGYASDYNRK